jgi:hypothetical protein
MKFSQTITAVRAAVEHAFKISIETRHDLRADYCRTSIAYPTVFGIVHALHFFKPSYE